MEVPQHTQSLYTHFNNLMYDSYKSQRLDKKVITLYQRRDKSEKDSKVSKRNKRSYKVIPNKQYDEDEGMTAMQEDIFKNFKGYTSKRGSHSSTHHGTGSDKTLNNYFQEFV
jgi:septin family protein